MNYENNIYCVRLEEANKNELRLEKELQVVKERLNEMKLHASSTSDEVEVLMEDRDYYREEYESIAGILEMKENEIEELEESHRLQKQKWKKERYEYEVKLKQVDEALKVKGKQLLEHINRDRGKERR